MACAFVSAAVARADDAASQDAYSGRNYSWVQPVSTYNFDDAGHFALSASYGYGNLEATANMASQFKVGLAGKF
jgi:hypothetical protein